MLKVNHFIRISKTQSVKLYFQNLYNSFVSNFEACKVKPIVNNLSVLYENGEQRIDKHLDVIKLIKDLKYIKLLAKFMLKPPIETKF